MNARPTLSGARWGFRPPDQRFDAVDQLRETLIQRRTRARTRMLVPERIQAHPGTAGIVLELDGEQLIPSALAASQISTAVGLHARTVRVLSPGLGAAALNERFELSLHERGGLRPNTTLLLEDQPDGPPRLRALQSSAYSRTWDIDVIDALVEPIVAAGYTPAAASVHFPDTNRALFSSDRDLFCFLVRDSPTDDLMGPHGRPLRRGIVIRNSEVGGISLSLRAFWFDSFCTNHMVFGGSMAVELVEPHRVGKAPPLQRLLDRWEAQGGLAALDRGRREEMEVIKKAMRFVVARRSEDPRTMDDEAVETVIQLARRAQVRTLLPRTLLKAGARRARVYAAARHPEATRTLDEREAVHIRGPGVTLWHMACGITEVSQELSAHTDRRARIDGAIGRVLSVV
jgi:hypothetical protein